MSKTIKQHFVPQCYLRQWSKDKKTIFINDCINHVSYKRKIENIFYLDKLYALGLSNINLIENKAELFDCCKEYTIVYNGKTLTSNDLDTIIRNFDSLIIKKNNVNISKKERLDLKEKIENSFSNEIEEDYSKFESVYNKKLFDKDFYDYFNNLSLDKKQEIYNEIHNCANNFYKRNPHTMNFHIDYTLSSIFFENEKELFKESKELIFKMIQKTFDKKFIPNCNLVFLVNNTNISFITSDIPIMLDLAIVKEEYSNNLYKSLFYFPLSPKLAVRFCFLIKKDNILVQDKMNEYFFYSCNNLEDVKTLNNKMISNCSNYVISCDNLYKIGTSNHRFDFNITNKRGIYNKLIKR